MVNVRTLPAGLLDDNIEFFNDPLDQEKCYCLTGGSVARINASPERVLAIIEQDMALHPNKVEALVEIGYEALPAQREKYCSCCAGEFDGNPDIKDGKFIHQEYVHCIHRGTCPVEGILCNALQVGNGKHLTPREIEVLILIGECKLNKEIADQLGISEETVKIHVKHIQGKAGLMNSKDLVKLAIQKNLI